MRKRAWLREVQQNTSHWHWFQVQAPWGELLSRRTKTAALEKIDAPTSLIPLARAAGADGFVTRRHQTFDTSNRSDSLQDSRRGHERRQRPAQSDNFRCAWRQPTLQRRLHLVRSLRHPKELCPSQNRRPRPAMCVDQLARPCQLAWAPTAEWQRTTVNAVWHLHPSHAADGRNCCVNRRSVVDGRHGGAARQPRLKGAGGSHGPGKRSALQSCHGPPATKAGKHHSLRIPAAKLRAGSSDRPCSDPPRFARGSKLSWHTSFAASGDTESHSGADAIPVRRGEHQPATSRQRPPSPAEARAGQAAMSAPVG